MSAQGALYEYERDRLIGRLDWLWSEARALRALAAPLREAQDAPAEATRQAITASARALEARARPLTAPLHESPQLDALAAGAVDDPLRRVEAVTKEADALAAQGAVAAVARGSAALLVTRLDELRDAYQILTVPYRTRQLLHGLPVGRPLEFAQVFRQDERPSAERRHEMLTELKRNAAYLNEGSVDVAREIIWRKSGSSAVRVASCFSPVAFAAIVAGLLLLLTVLVEHDPLDEPAEVMTTFGLVLGGTGFHLLVENVKLSQARDTPIIAIGSLIDWLHLRWAAIGGTFFAILVTVVGLRLVLDEETLEGGWETSLLFFFAGYSVDSVAGILLNRFGTTAEGGVSSLLRRLQPAGEDAT